ncbi:MAG: hypothetical protein J6Z08_01080 [Elusimicrobiales bacterium]|nr:hypothetical protein [Elusimicrobiales bacterium]
MKKVLLSLLIIAAGYAFYVCNQNMNDMRQKLELMQNDAAKHQEEMTNLKKENTSLKDTIAELSENEQNKFSKSYDLLRNAKEAKDFRMAEEAFASFLAKYPASSYMEQAKKAQKEANTKAQYMEYLDKNRSLIKQQIKDKEWEASEKTLELLSKYISQEEYKEYEKTIDDEKNKPIETTITNLISYEIKFDRKRVKINATCQSINLAEKYLYVEDSGFSIRVSYYGLPSVVARFANNPRCNNVKIVGVFKVGVYGADFGDFIDRTTIYAESIEDLF